MEGKENSYQAPEYLFLLKGGKEEGVMNMEKCDIYSLGMIVFKAYTRLTEE